MKTRYGQKILIIVKLSLFMLFISLTGCHKTKIVTAESILVIKNGERIQQAKDTGGYRMAMDDIARVLSQTLLRRRIEKTTRQEIENTFQTSVNAYLLKYDRIYTMNILREGAYTEDVPFQKIYIIRKLDVHYIYFVVEGEPHYYPFIPFSEVTRLPRN